MKITAFIAGLLFVVFLVVSLALIPHYKQYKDCITEQQSKATKAPLEKSPPIFITCEASFIDRHNGVVAASATIVIAFFTLVLWIATILLWETGERQLRLAKDSSERQLRAYVFPSGIPTSLSLQDVTNFIIEYKFWFRWENSGLTPATECAMWTACMPVPISNPKPIAFTKAGRPAIKMPLGPKQGIDSTQIAITAADLVDIFDKKARYYIWGLAEYRDVFSGANAPLKHTEVCLEVFIDFDPRKPVYAASPKSLRFQGVTEHNSSS